MVRLEKIQRPFQGKGEATTTPMTKTNTLRFSLRIYSAEYPQGKVTSITLRKSIVILWVLFGTRNFTFENKQNLHDRIEGILTDFIHNSLKKWEYTDGRGLSDFILECMYKDFLVKSDYKRYKQLMRTL